MCSAWLVSSRWELWKRRKELETKDFWVTFGPLRSLSFISTQPQRRPREFTAASRLRLLLFVVVLKTINDSDGNWCAKRQPQLPVFHHPTSDCCGRQREQKQCHRLTKYFRLNLAKVYSWIERENCLLWYAISWELQVAFHIGSMWLEKPRNIIP